jgi:hypothetical protein
MPFIRHSGLDPEPGNASDKNMFFLKKLAQAIISFQKNNLMRISHRIPDLVSRRRGGPNQ